MKIYTVIGIITVGYLAVCLAEKTLSSVPEGLKKIPLFLICDIFYVTLFTGLIYLAEVFLSK